MVWPSRGRRTPLGLAHADLQVTRPPECLHFGHEGGLGEVNKNELGGAFPGDPLEEIEQKRFYAAILPAASQPGEIDRNARWRVTAAYLQLQCQFGDQIGTPRQGPGNRSRAQPELRIASVAHNRKPCRVYFGCSVHFQDVGQFVRHDGPNEIAGLGFPQHKSGNAKDSRKIAGIHAQRETFIYYPIGKGQGHACPAAGGVEVGG